jgi:hypothetical protein
MNCKETIHELSAYLDNEVSDPVRRAIEAHVGSCAGCRARLDELRRISTGIAALPAIPVSDDLARAVRQRIRTGDVSPAADSWWERLIHPGWFKIPLQATALLAVFIGITMMVRTYREGQPTEMAKTEKRAPYDSPTPYAVGDESEVTKKSADKLAEVDGRIAPVSGELERDAKKERIASDTLSRSKADRGYTANEPTPPPLLAPSAPAAPQNKPAADEFRYAQTAPPKPLVVAQEPAKESSAAAKIQSLPVDNERKRRETLGDNKLKANQVSVTNVFLVASSDATAVMQQASVLATQLNGQLTTGLRQSEFAARGKDSAPVAGLVLGDADDAAGTTFTVELPSSQVASFTSKLVTQVAQYQRTNQPPSTIQPSREENALAKSGSEITGGRAGSASRGHALGGAVGQGQSAPIPAGPPATNATVDAERTAESPAATTQAVIPKESQEVLPSSRPLLDNTTPAPAAAPSDTAQSDRIILIIKVVPVTP